jgi:hypothetical protein
MDVSMISEEQRLDEFNRAVPAIGREVLYFVGDMEVESVLLQPGQPYSVYPKHFQRTDDTKANVAGMEGPRISVQWILPNTDRAPLVLATRAMVPEEITLLQLWKLIIAPRYTLPAQMVMWGNHYREGPIIETAR